MPSTLSEIKWKTNPRLLDYCCDLGWGACLSNCAPRVFLFSLYNFNRCSRHWFWKCDVRHVAMLSSSPVTSELPQEYLNYLRITSKIALPQNYLEWCKITLIWGDGNGDVEQCESAFTPIALDKHERDTTVFSGLNTCILNCGPHLPVTVPQQHPPSSQHRIPCNMAFPTPPHRDTDEYYTDELEMNCLFISNFSI